MPYDGLLTPGGRQAAVQSSLGFLATYFEKGDPSALALSEQVGGLDDVDAAFAWAIRLRVALAHGRRLEAVLHAVAMHPSFRYTRVTDEAIGAVKGRLDLQRYLKER